jgi:hypothetical protein
VEFPYLCGLISIRVPGEIKKIKGTNQMGLKNPTSSNNSFCWSLSIDYSKRELIYFYNFVAIDRLVMKLMRNLLTV